MNKLASIFFLQGIGIPTVWPNIIISRENNGVRREVNSFYYEYSPGWVLRCGEPPERTGKVERGMPWDIAKSNEELIQKIIGLQKEIGDKYLVFCHPVAEMVRGGVMLIEGDQVVIEAASGGPRELSAFYRGRRDPEQQIIFAPGMFSNKRYGSEILNNMDLRDIRNVERKLNWSDLNAVTEPVAVEFSRLKNNTLYVHDVTVAN
jgi:hypothetical protein